MTAGISIAPGVPIHYEAPQRDDVTLCEAGGASLPAGEIGLVIINGPCEGNVNCANCIAWRHA